MNHQFNFLKYPNFGAVLNTSILHFLRCPVPFDILSTSSSILQGNNSHSFDKTLRGKLLFLYNKEMYNINILHKITFLFLQKDQRWGSHGHRVILVLKHVKWFSWSHSYSRS